MTKTTYVVQRILIICFIVLLGSSCARLPLVEKPEELLTTEKERSANAYYHYARGTIHAQNGEFDEAADQLRKALTFDPESPYLLTQLASIYIRKRDLSTAVEILNGVLVNSPDDVDTHILLGMLYGRTKEYEKAIGEYQRVLTLDPEKKEVYLFLSSLYRETDNAEKAIASLHTLLEKDPHNLLASYYLGQIHAERQLYKKAETWFKKALDIKPNFEPALFDLTRLYHIAKKNDKVIETYRKFLQLTPASKTVRLKLANFLFSIEKYREAVGEFEELLRLDDTNMQARFSLGLSHYFTGDNYGNALKIFKEILLRSPDDDKALFFSASCHEKMGNTSGALVEFEKVSRESNLYGNSRIRMALIIKNEKGLEEAIKFVETVLEEAEREGELYEFLASLYEENEAAQSALELLSRGIDLLPENTSLRYKLGALYGRLERHEESIDQMEEILRYDARNAEAMNFIGYSLADRGIRLDYAEQLIKQALSLKPGNGYITDSLGWVYFRQNKIRLALKYLEKAASMLPDDPVIAEHLGDAYERTGRLKKALAIYKKARKTAKDGKGLEDKINRISRLLKAGKK